MLRIYVSGRGDYLYTRRYFNEKTKGSLQGKYPQTEQFLSMMRKHDQALRELIAYFKQSEGPAAVVVFGDVSLNYFASILLKEIGIPISEYQQCTLQQYLRVPVMNILGIKDSNGALYQICSREFSRMTEEYRMLTYNYTNHKEKWRKVFSGLETE